MHTRRVRLGLAALGVGLLLVLSSCTTTTPPPDAPQVNIVWPPSPEEPRIAYVRSLRQPADAGVKQSGFRRLVNKIAGADRGNECLVKPFGVALDENDNLCLTDTGANAVIYFDRVKLQWHRWERVGRARFIAPVAVAKANGVLYVADSGLGQVIAFDEDGKLRWTTRDELAHPAGLAIAGGRLFVADAHKHRIAIFDLAGKYQASFGKRGAGPGEFNYPTHVAADANGRIFVTDSMNSRVQVFDTNGTFQSQFGKAGDVVGYFSRPKGVALDSFGHVYVIDANFDNFQIFDLQGRILLTVGDAGGEPGQFWLPNGIAISRKNEIFVTDSYNHRLQIFKYVGQP